MAQDEFVLDNPVAILYPHQMEYVKSLRCTLQGDAALKLCEVVVRRVRTSEAWRYQDLMQQHHYLGSLPKIGETLWYVAT
ncbi:MAG: hypothetical protein ACLQVL_11510 [Terriglobia bacterium]